MIKHHCKPIHTELLQEKKKIHREDKLYELPVTPVFPEVYHTNTSAIKGQKTH